MTVNPMVANAPQTNNTLGGQDSMMPPISPSDVQLENALRSALVEPPAGEVALSNVATAVNNTGHSYPYNATFDPTSHFDIQFNPNSTDNGGAWDSFDTSMVGTGGEIGGIDWDALVNDDCLA